MNEDYYHEQNSCYDSNSFGFDQFQPPQYTVNHPIFNAQNELLNSQNKLMEQMTSICDMVGQYLQKKEEDKRIAEDQAAKDQYWKIPICYNDDDDEYSFATQEYLKKFSSAITPDLPKSDSLIMEDEHLDTIPETESDELIKSSVEDLVHTPSESDGISEGECDLPVYDDFSPKKDEVLDDIISIPPGNGNDHFNAESSLIESVLNRDNVISSPKIDFLIEEFAGELALIAPIPPGIVEADLDPKEDIRFIENLMYDNSFPRPPETLKDDSETVIDSNNDYFSSDDDSYENIEYVEASPPDLEIVSLEEVNDVDQEKEEFDLENILQIQDVILREKLLNINRLIANIESLNDNSTPNCVIKSHSPFPIPDSKSFFEKSNTSLSYSDNSLPEFESFSDHTEETSSGSTTTHANNSLLEYDSFHFEIEPDQGELTNVVMGEPRVHTPNVLPNHPTLLIDSDFIIRTFLPYFTYPVISYFLFSSRNEDIIFDPGIFTFHFFSLKPMAYENPIVIFLFFYFCPKDKGIRGESS
ncbi:hypothetical protein Tco_0722630 [Tanacetum coccineum]